MSPSPFVRMFRRSADLYSTDSRILISDVDMSVGLNLSKMWNCMGGK